MHWGWGGGRTGRRRAAVGMLVAAGGLMVTMAGGVGTADAHESPQSCNSNSVDVTPTRDRLLVRNGDVITYTVSLKNVDVGNQTACDLDHATVSLTLPAPDGTPTGRKVVLESDAAIPAGTSKMYPNKIAYTVAVDPGVKDAVVLAQVDGTLHDAPVDHAASIRKTLGTTVTQPHTTLAVTATPARGRAPLDVTYTYTEKNDSSTDVPIANVTVADTNCSPVVFQNGDTNNDRILGTGEVWAYTCHKRITSGGSVTSDVVAKGTSTIDNRAAPDELARVTVIVGQPHARLTKVASPTTGPVPFAATYTYSYTNDGRDPIAQLELSDDNCAPVTLAAGDGNHNGVVDPGETWTLRCSRTFTAPGTYPNTVSATGIDTVDRIAMPILTASARVQVVPGTTTSTTVAGTTPTTVAGPPPAAGSVSAGATPATVLGHRALPATRRSSGVLAFTGWSRLLIAVLAAVAVAIGLALAILGRRRRSEG